MEDISEHQHIGDFGNDRECYRYETNRLESYAGWPASNPMFPTTLAKVGLYYTGQEDEVQCFVCGIRIKRWAETDLPLSEHERHSPRCPFILGCNVGNVPLLAGGEEFNLDKIREREQNLKALRANVPGQLGGGSSLNSNTIQSLFNNNSSTGQNRNSPQSERLVEDNLTSTITGTSVTQTCNSSNYTSSSEALHDASLTESNNYPSSAENCRTEINALQTGSSHNVQKRKIITGRIQSHADSACFSIDTSVSSASFPATLKVPEELCNLARVTEMMHHAAHPQYADIAPRFRSFRLWQSASIQPVARMCQAGFFYTGEGDRVRCFMCGGGLCNWQSEDAPWREHVRWFNRCEYLDACRNVPEVQTAISSIPNSVRAGIGSRTDIDDGVRSGPEVGALSIPVDEQSLEMGYTKETTMAGDRKFDLSTIIAENQALRDRGTCKVCLANQVAIVFLPCGHLSCCLDCAMQLQKCPICREHIKATVKVFIG